MADVAVEDPVSVDIGMAVRVVCTGEHTEAEHEALVHAHDAASGRT